MGLNIFLYKHTHCWDIQVIKVKMGSVPKAIFEKTCCLKKAEKKQALLDALATNFLWDFFHHSSFSHISLKIDQLSATKLLRVFCNDCKCARKRLHLQRSLCPSSALREINEVFHTSSCQFYLFWFGLRSDSALPPTWPLFNILVTLMMKSLRQRACAQRKINTGYKNKLELSTITKHKQRCKIMLGVLVHIEILEGWISKQSFSIINKIASRFFVLLW